MTRRKSSNGGPRARAMNLLHQHVRAQRRSLRQIAAGAGLASHAPLSRFLRGEPGLGFEGLVKICEFLGIEGRDFDRIVFPFLPQGVEGIIGSRASNAKGKANSQGAGNVRPTRRRMSGFFLREKCPVVYEVAKLLGQGCASDVRAALNPRYVCDGDEVKACLRNLDALGLVRCPAGDEFSVVDVRQDIVIPSRHTSEVGKAVIREAIEALPSYLDGSPHDRIMRSVVFTARATPDGDPFTHVRQEILRLQDALLESQTDDDDVVVRVFVGATQIAREHRPRGPRTPAPLEERPEAPA